MSSEYDSRTTTDSNQDDETTTPRQPTTGSQVVWDVPNKDENRKHVYTTHRNNMEPTTGMTTEEQQSRAERSVSSAQKLMKGGKAMFNTSDRKSRVASAGSRTNQDRTEEKT
jgi:hypothetical protein